MVLVAEEFSGKYGGKVKMRKNMEHVCPFCKKEWNCNPTYRGDEKCGYPFVSVCFKADCIAKREEAERIKNEKK